MMVGTAIFNIVVSTGWCSIISRRCCCRNASFFAMVILLSLCFKFPFSVQFGYVL
jgi:hypothetical protein